MGPYPSEPWTELKVEHLKESRQDRQESGPNSKPPRQAQVRVNFTQKSSVKEQVAGKGIGQKVITHCQLIRTAYSNEKAGEWLVYLKVIKQHNIESEDSKGLRRKCQVEKITWECQEVWSFISKVREFKTLLVWPHGWWLIFLPNKLSKYEFILLYSMNFFSGKYDLWFIEWKRFKKLRWD